MTLFSSLEAFSKRTALVSSKHGIIKYTDLINYERKLKNVIEKESLIIIISTNSLLPIITYIFGVRNNCKVMMVDSKTNTDEIKKIINIYQHEYIILPEKMYKERLFDDNKKLFSDYDYVIIKNIKLYKNKSKINKKISVLLPTSGSMGSPKFVMLSQENITSNTKSIIQFLKIKKDDRAITTMPMSYTYMLSIINTHIEVGALIVVTEDSLISRQFWDTYNQNKVTSFSGVPYLFEILKKLKFERIFIPSLKTITQAGGKLDKNIINSISSLCEKKDVEFITMYGQTEATARISYLDYKYLNKKIGSIGKVIPGGKMWLEDSSKKIIVKPGQKGELIYEGPNVFIGYANTLSDLIKPKKQAKILKTGDIASFDKDNFFYIEGRIKRIAKIFGNRFNLDEIEDRMLKLNFEIFCRDSEKKLLVYFDKEYSEKDILMNLASITHQNKVAFKCIKLSNIPRTNSGKVDFGMLSKI